MWLITWLFFPSGRCFQVWRQTCDSGVTGRNTIPKGTRVTYYLKTSIMTFWNETYLKCYIVLPTMKTCLIVTILCLQWGTYVIYLSKVFAHQKLFLLYAQPQKFHPASNHCLTAIIGMSLKYSRLKRFCQTSEKGKANHMALEQYDMRTFLHRGGGVSSSHWNGDRWQSEE